MFTRVKDPNEPFQFSFPDLNGQLISNTDVRLRGVTIACATGETLVIARERGVETAAKRLNRTRRSDFDLTVGG